MVMANSTSGLCFDAPLLEPIRKAMGSFGTGGVQVDFSPMVLIILLIVLKSVVLSFLP